MTLGDHRKDLDPGFLKVELVYVQITVDKYVSEILNRNYLVVY